MLKPIDAGTGFLKASVFGEAGTGKTTLGVSLLLGTRRTFGLKGPIVMLDSENGSPWVSKRVKDETGLELIGLKTRRFDDLRPAIKECIEIGAAGLMVDSITHFWDELNVTYLRSINEERKRSRMSSLEKLEFQHLAKLKIMWGEWTTAFLNSPLHIVTCGRSQNKWAFEEDERGKKQLVQTGTRLRAEREFGHEASILIEMTSSQTMDRDRTTSVVHTAFVEKDRNQDPATTLVGKSFDQPTFKDFMPHLATIVPGSHKPVDELSSKIEVDAEGNSRWQQERRQREIALEELAAELDKVGLGGSSAEAKSKRPLLLEKCFGTASKTKLEGMDSVLLRDGLAKVREEIAKMKPVEEKSNG